MTYKLDQHFIFSLVQGLDLGLHCGNKAIKYELADY